MTPSLKTAPLFLPLLLAVSPSACDAVQDAVVADSPPLPETRYYMDPPGMVVEDWVTGLEVVWEMRFLPDGRLLVSERAGRIRMVDADGALQPEPWAAPERVFHSGGGGAMGLALHPDFPEEPWVYLMYTEDLGDRPRNRVVRLRDEGTRGTGMEVVLDDLPAANTHNGGRIAFGPDGMLYVTIGDTGQAEQSQELEDLRGSILRVTPEGGVPEDNPWEGSPVWAHGLRNPQGLAFHPWTGSLLAADHGPESRDQLHRIQGGLNYGWPRVLGAAGVEGFEDPILEWVPAAPPGDLIFYDGELLEELRGDLLLTTLRSEALLRIRFQDPTDPYRPTAKERWFVSEDLGDFPMGQGDSRFGRLRALEVGPDGALYLGTSNRDRGRGNIREGDDRIVRISPTPR
jgi:glucose/arabinose dehydrogenase